VPFNTAVAVGITPQAAAASLDYPQCLDWWNNQINPALQFEYEIGAGPSANRMSAFTLQNSISSAFPPAHINSGVQGANYDCTGIVSSITSLPTVPRLLTYANVNGSGPNYTSNSPVVCVGYDNLLGSPGPYSYLNGTSLGQTGNFAIYNISQCSSNLSSVTCVPSISLNTVTPGDQVFAASNFGGGGGGDGTGCCGSGDNWWIWMIVGIAGAILLILLIVLIVFLATRKRKVVPATAPVYAEVVNAPPSDVLVTSPSFVPPPPRIPPRTGVGRGAIQPIYETP
jgi:hypothetical protein